MQDGTKRRLLFRQVNKAIREMSRQVELTNYRVFCECERAECGTRIDVSDSVYEEVLSAESRFIVVPGHEEGASEDATFVPAVGSDTSVDEVSAA